MTTTMQIGKTARDRADFCRCFETGAAVFLHDDGIVAHSTFRNTPREFCAPARTYGHARLQGCIRKPVGFGAFSDLARALRGRLYPDEPTSSGSFGRSEKCHMRIW